MKESFLLYNNFYEPLKCLTNEQLGRLFKAIFEFNINGIEEVEPDIRIAFAFIKNQINIDSKKYEEQCKKNAENGAKGGRPKKANALKENPTKPSGFENNPEKPNGFLENPTKPKKADNDNENDNDNEDDNENDNDDIALSETGVSTSDTAKASKHKYGEYKHVLLKDEELQKLKRDFSNWKELIKYLDEYIEMKGYKANSHYLAIRKWVVDAVKKEKNRNDTKPVSNNNQTSKGNVFFDILREGGQIQ